MPKRTGVCRTCKLRIVEVDGRWKHAADALTVQMAAMKHGKSAKESSHNAKTD